VSAATSPRRDKQRLVKVAGGGRLAGRLRKHFFISTGEKFSLKTYGPALVYECCRGGQDRKIRQLPCPGTNGTERRKEDFPWPKGKSKKADKESSQGRAK